MNSPLAVKYKNKSGILLESDRLAAVFLPETGAKLASLVDKKTNFEFLVQRPAVVYREQPFDGVYVNGECSGYDDMFPTIDECRYENDPWKNVKMADHGEVWSLPWQYETTADALHMSVNGVRFPYRLEKGAVLRDERTLRLSYRLTNNSGSDFEFLWAGHMMFNIEEGARMVVPDDCRQAVRILSDSGAKFGDVSDWPYFLDKNGRRYRADVCRPKTAQGFEKYYFKNKLKNGWCELVYPEGGKRIKVTFPTETVPYLGILMNENGWDGLYNIFVEPCTVCYDRPDVARKYGQVSKIAASASATWWIEMVI